MVSHTLFAHDGENEAFLLLEPAELLERRRANRLLPSMAVYRVLNNTPVDASLYFDADGNFLYAYAFPTIQQRKPVNGGDHSAGWRSFHRLRPVFEFDAQKRTITIIVLSMMFSRG